MKAGGAIKTQKMGIYANAAFSQGFPMRPVGLPS